MRQKIGRLILKKTNRGAYFSIIRVISKLKSLDMVYLTNNICESIHSKISKYLPKGPITKMAFRETINSVINDYSYKIHKCIRRDYITRTLIILVDKYKLNQKPIFIEFDTLKNEIENTISIITGKIKINAIDEIFYGLDKLNLEENMDNLINNNIEESFKDEGIKNNEEDKNLDIESIDNSLLDLIDEENLEFSFTLEEKEEADDNYNSLEFENELENISSDDNNVINIDKIIKERDYLNIFTLEVSDYKNKLRKILLPEEEKDLESIEDKILNLYFDKKNNPKGYKKKTNKKK